MLVGVIGVVVAGCGFFALNSKKKESPYHVFTVKAADAAFIVQTVQIDTFRIGTDWRNAF